MMNATTCAQAWWRVAGVVLGISVLVIELENLQPALAQADKVDASWFVEMAEQAGVVHKHSNRTFKNAYAHIMQGYASLGAAVAVGDYNGDGFEDVFATDSQENGKNLLYRNNGDFTFTEVGEAAGVAQGNDAANASADALWFDYNNDGRLDLLVVRFGHNQLFENRGDGTFTEVSSTAGLSQEYRNSIAAIAFDYDLDKDLDLVLGHYFQPVNLFNPPTAHFFPESFETANNGGGVTLYRNNGDGTFTDITAQAGLRLSGWTLDLGHADVDHDGDDDLYVAADFGTDRFFLNNGDGTFTDATEQAIGIDTKKGMNADWGDFNNDGLFDVYVTNITDEYMREGNFLWKNNGDLTFADVSRETGTYDTGWGWAGKFFDYDNDGWQDLYVVNGWVSAGEENYVVDIFQLLVSPNVDLADARNWPPMGNKTLSGYQENCLFHNQGGMLFKNDAARHGVNSKLDGRGIGVADFDHDGRLDMLVSNANARPLLFRNVQPTGNHWVEFALRGTQSNAFAVGARLWLTTGGQTQVGFVNGGNGFASQSTLRVHFGLGKAALIDRLEVAWPQGTRQTFVNLQPDRIYAIVEGQADVQPLQAQALKKSPQSSAESNGSAPNKVAEFLFQEALRAAESADYDTALGKFEAALKADPNNLRYGNAYRLAAVKINKVKTYDRCMAFFKQLVAEHPKASNAWMHYGYAYVDKIPHEGAITQVLMANAALGYFSTALELEDSWLGRYTRGNSYLYWPTIFGRTPLAIADLEKAIALSGQTAKRSYHARAYVGLGDAYWRLSNLDKARQIWREALRLFPDNADLQARLGHDDKALHTFLNAHFEAGKRVDTDVSSTWE